MAALPGAVESMAEARDEEERRLESLVFGSESQVVSRLQKRKKKKRKRRDSAEEDDGEVAEGTDALFQLDREGETGPSQGAEDSGAGGGEAEVRPSEGGQAEVSGDEADAGEEEASRQPVWHDEDDELVTAAEAAAVMARDAEYRPSIPGQTRYRAALEKRFKTVVGAPDWARLDRKRKRRGSDDEDEGEVDPMLASTGHLLATEASRLAKGSLLVKRCRDLSAAAGPMSRTVSAVEFHPRSQVALVASSKGSVSIVQVDGTQNSLIQAVEFPGFRVHCAHFTRDGEQLVVGSEFSRHLFYYDMMSGKQVRVNAGQQLDVRGVPQLHVSPDGRWLAVPGARAGAVHLLSARTKEWAASLQASGRLSALCFSPDGSRLFTHGEEGLVYEWDVAARRCVHRFTDQGCLAGTSVACSPDGRLLACGSSSGIVNVYEMSTARGQEHPEPFKVLDNLTTSCTQLLFNPTAEILAMCSAQKENAVKLVHVPSMTVFSNFPGWTKAVKEPHCLDFSLNGGYMTIGNNNARALLYRVQHYSSY